MKFSFLLALALATTFSFSCKKEKAYPEDHVPGIAQFFFLQCGSYKAPEFPENKREGGNNTPYQRNGDTAEELATESICDQVHFYRRHTKRITHMRPVAEIAERLITDEIGIDGSADDIVEYPVAVNEDHNGHYQDGDH